MIITELEQTCMACPAQWEGRTDDGQHVYIRSRHDRLTVGVGQTIDDAIMAGEPVVDVEDGAGGWLREPELGIILLAHGIEIRA